MKVLKRNGIVQNFDSEKVRLSIEKASDEIGEPLTKSDLDNIVGDIEYELSSFGKPVVDSRKIYNVVLNILRDFGLQNVGDEYMKFRKNSI